MCEQLPHQVKNGCSTSTAFYLMCQAVIRIGHLARKAHCYLTIGLMICCNPAWSRFEVVGIYTEAPHADRHALLHGYLYGYNAFNNYRKRINYTFKQQTPLDEYEKVIRKHAEKGVDFIVSEGFGVDVNIRNIIRDYPKVNFLIFTGMNPDAPRATADYTGWKPYRALWGIFGVSPASCEIEYKYPDVNFLAFFGIGWYYNCANFDFYPYWVYLNGDPFSPYKANVDSGFAVERPHEPCYLLGIAAANLSKSKVIGIIGDTLDYGNNTMFNAFVAGARSVEPKIEFAIQFQKRYNIKGNGDKKVDALINAGVDVIFSEQREIVELATHRELLAFGGFNYWVPSTHELFYQALDMFEKEYDKSYNIDKFLNRKEKYRYGEGHCGSSEGPFYDNFENRLSNKARRDVEYAWRQIMNGQLTVIFDENEPNP